MILQEVVLAQKELVEGLQEGDVGLRREVDLSSAVEFVALSLVLHAFVHKDARVDELLSGLFRNAVESELLCKELLCNSA